MKKQYQIPVANIFGMNSEDVHTDLLFLFRVSSESDVEVGKARSVIDFEGGVLATRLG